MEMRPGYKQNEVGVIAEDWETDTLFRISRQIMDYRGRTPKKLGMDWGGGDIPALSAGNVKKGFIDFREECYFGSDDLYRRWMTKGDVAKGDILFTTEAPLGNVALVPDDRRYILSQRTVLLRVDPTRVSNQFLFQVMLSGGFQQMLADYSSGSTAKGIQRRKFEQLQVALPSLREQCAIAAALSDMDTLLDGLDRLIAKKRDIKQAALQQLLTGRTRLPGFSGAWEVVRMRHVLDQNATYGIVTAGAFVRNGVKMLRSGDIVDGWINTDLPMVTREKAEEYRRTQLLKDDVVIALVGYPGASAKIPDELVGANISRAVGLLRTNERVAADYLVCFLNAPDGRRMVLAPSAGSAQQVVNLAALNKLEFRIPPLPEQVSIAAVLSDMDAELVALEKRRDKTRLLKQAMMPELLTGKTRLVPTAVVHA